MSRPKPTIEIIRTLGVGGMASVYLARLEQGGARRLVAVKSPHPYLAHEASVVAAFEDEREIGERIDHPNVVRVFGLHRVKPADAPSLIMEWIDGVDLATLLRGCPENARSFAPEVAVAIVCDVLAGLHAAHEARGRDGRALDIVHRDVSPHNVIVGFDGVGRVTDFGIAKAARRHVHTETGVVKGKLGYLACEQLEGRADRRSDVFGAGALLWELLTGTRLRKGSGVEMLVEIMNGRIEAPSKHAPSAAPLDDVVGRALSRAPEDRFETAEEMRETLARAMARAPADRVARAVRERVMAEASGPATDVFPDEVTEQDTLRGAVQPADPAMAGSGERPCVPLQLLRRKSA